VAHNQNFVKKIGCTKSMNVNIFSVNASTAFLLINPDAKTYWWFKKYIWLFLLLLLFFVTIMLNVNFFTLIHLIKT